MNWKNNKEHVLMNNALTKIAKSEDNDDWMQLLAYTDKIKNKEIRDFTRSFLKDVVPDYFARIPASSTGKYHPEYSLGYGGLVRHTLAAATIAYGFIQLDYLKLNQYDKDLIIAAVLLHDTFKQGTTESGHTIRTHPNVAATEIYKFAKSRNQEHIGKIIGALVVSHMGEWGNQRPGNRGQFLVHLADFLASRVYITVDLTEN